MQKFDLSCGLTKSQIGIIKYRVKRGIERHLPILPEFVETKLFFEGRYAWAYSWCLLNNAFPIRPGDEIRLEVVAKLKKEFHQYQKRKRYEFLAKINLREDIYQSEVLIRVKLA